MVNWKFKRDYTYFEDYKIFENVHWGSKRTSKDYSLYLKDDLLFTGSFKECKDFTSDHLNNR